MCNYAERVIAVVNPSRVDVDCHGMEMIVARGGKNFRMRIGASVCQCPHVVIRIAEQSNQR